MATATGITRLQLQAVFRGLLPRVDLDFESRLLSKSIRLRRALFPPKASSLNVPITAAIPTSTNASNSLILTPIGDDTCLLAVIEPASNSSLGDAPRDPSKPVSSLRWWIHLILIGSYPIVIGLASGLTIDTATEPAAALSADPQTLLQTIGLHLGIFFLLFGLAWGVSKATPQQLLLPWNLGWKPLWRGFLYSIGLRFALGGLAVALLLVAMLFGGIDEQTIEDVRPKVEHTIDTEAIESSSLYVILNATLVSFVFAGFREELWRIGVLAGLQALFPKLFQSVAGKLGAIAIVAVIFGLGHYSQGWGGVAITTLLGIGLGAIMVFHRSLWDAVLAHGFFNASSFIMVHLLLRYFPEYSPF